MLSFVSRPRISKIESDRTKYDSALGYSELPGILPAFIPTSRVGLLGGPPLYQQLYGNPALRARHMPFPIDEAARQEWLRCFDLVLAAAPVRYDFPAEHLAGFRAFLDGFSGWMVNTASGDYPTTSS